MKRNRIFMWIFFAVGLICLVLAAIFIARNYLEDMNVRNTTQSILSQIYSDTADTGESLDEISTDSQIDEAADNILSNESNSDVPDYVLNPDIDMTVKYVNVSKRAEDDAAHAESDINAELEDYFDNNDRLYSSEYDYYVRLGYCAILEMPAISIEVPILSEWNFDDLIYSPCRYSGSAYTDDLVIAAHNYDSHFGRIYLLNIGDEIKLTDMEGNVFNYRVAAVETLNPNAVDEIKHSEWDLTLFTCTLSGAARVTVRCDKV